MSISNEEIIELIRANPEGLTTKDVAEKLDAKIWLNSRLSKLFYYGIITRRRIPGPKNKMLWLPKESEQ